MNQCTVSVVKMIIKKEEAGNGCFLIKITGNFFEELGPRRKIMMMTLKEKRDHFDISGQAI